MPKQTLPLTDSQCKKLQPPNQLSDGGGLYLQARGNGKYWRFRYYRPSDNKRDEMRLGVYPEISLKEAREKREELRGLIAKGIDSKLYQQDKAQRQVEQLKNTFEAIARKWHSDHWTKTTASTISPALTCPMPTSIRHTARAAWRQPPSVPPPLRPKYSVCRIRYRKG